MAIAWATVVFLILLLPGFAFFAGVTSASRFTRDAMPQSAVAQLAGILHIGGDEISNVIFGQKTALQYSKEDLQLLENKLQAHGAQSRAEREAPGPGAGSSS